MKKLFFSSLALVVLCVAPAHAQGAGAFPRNPFLADSDYAVGHGNSQQNDSTDKSGPIAASHVLTPQEILKNEIGPGHMGNLISSPYPDGRRVIWTNAQNTIVKLDYKSLRVLATLKTDGATEVKAFDESQISGVIQKLNSGSQAERVGYAAQFARSFQPADMASIYTVLSHDNRYYVGRSRGVSAYADIDPKNPDSDIQRVGDWELPADIPGTVVVMNMTFDGWIVFATNAGAIVTLSRDFNQYYSVMMAHSEEAAAYNARMAAERRIGYDWVRNGIAIDPEGGLYVAANDWMAKVVWTGRGLSVDPKDGAWAERYANSTGTGTGSTPVLLGYGKGDRLVAITDGETLMNVTLFWRDQPPVGAQRTAGKLPVTLGDPGLKALQSEQAITASGFSMVVVNNEPPKIPEGMPKSIKGLLIGFLPEDPDFSPHGMQAFRWNETANKLENAWVNSEVSSPNCVPFISRGSKRVYTIGVVDGTWTLQALRLADGRMMERYAIGDSRFNPVFSGIVVDDDKSILYGGMFGTVRLRPLIADGK